MITVAAPAKLTLLLDVGPRGADGLHPLVGVFQSVGPTDLVVLWPSERWGIEVTGPAATGVPADETNLALRAARTFAALHFAPEQAVEIALTKQIPAGGGLGGGSSDAAAVLVGLNEATGGTVSRKALEKLAIALGSDVPFCVRGGTAVVEGTGGRLTSLPVASALSWVLVTSETRCSTADVYARFDELGLGRDLDLRAGPQALADALAKGDLERIAASLSNDLEPAALSLHPELAAGRDALRDAGALGVVLAGSGSTWAGLARDPDHALAIAARTGGIVADSAIDGPRTEDEPDDDGIVLTRAP